MKKLLQLCTVLLLSLVFVACSRGTKRDENTIVVGASYTPHAVILEEAKDLLKKKGYTLVIQEYTDYVQPNVALVEGELDANYFQHLPYLTNYNAQNNTNIVSVGGIHIEPIGIYSHDSRGFDNVSDIPKGSLIALSNSVSDHTRILSMLNQLELIQLEDGVDVNTLTIEEVEESSTRNPKNFKFKFDIDPGLLVSVLENNEAAAVIINTNFVLDHGYNPLEDALVLESGEDNPYANVIAVNEGQIDDPKILALMEVLRSKEIQDFIVEEFGGAVIPA